MKRKIIYFLLALAVVMPASRQEFLKMPSVYPMFHYGNRAIRFM